MRFADRLGDARSSIYLDVVNSRRTILFRIVIQRSRYLAGDVLEESSAERDIENLGAPAYGENRSAGFLRRLDESDLRAVPLDVRWTASVSSGLSIQRWLYIFAASEKQSIHARQDCVGGFIACERRYDEWYEACTLQCRDVRVVQPHAMRISTA
jgi:hypothetical protein